MSAQYCVKVSVDEVNHKEVKVFRSYMWLRILIQFLARPKLGYNVD